MKFLNKFLFIEITKNRFHIASPFIYYGTNRNFECLFNFSKIRNKWWLSIALNHYRLEVYKGKILIWY